MDTRCVDKFCEDEDPKVQGENEFIISENSLEQTTFTDSKLNANVLVTGLRSLQLQEFSLPTKYRTVWDNASKIFKERREQGHYSPDCYKDIPDEYHIALIAYSLKEPGIYADFNKQTRNILSRFDIQKYPYKSFYQLLKLAVESISEQKSLQKPTPLYRGINFTMEIPYAIGDTLHFRHFVSTSSSFEVAKSFGNVLYVFHDVKPEMSLSMDDHSHYKFEHETLLCPGQQFTIFKYEIVDGRHIFHMKPKLW